MRLSNVSKPFEMTGKPSKPNTTFNNSLVQFEKEVSYIYNNGQNFRSIAVEDAARRRLDGAASLAMH